MLISLILLAVYGLLVALFFGVNLPGFPDGFLDIMADAQVYLVTGFRVLGAYVDLHYIRILFTTFLSLYVFYDMYLLVMWILRKIPLLGIK